MDNIECLKVLTENIIKKQNDSSESVKKLIRRTDMISSDISNLINSLQMVGNRQFAENRVQEEATISEQQQSLNFRQQQQPNEIYTTTGCSQVSSGYKLSSILLKAIELIPSRPRDLHSLQLDSEEKQSDQLMHEDSLDEDQQLEHHEHQLQLAPPDEQVDAPRTFMDEIRQSISETLKSNTLEVGSVPHLRPELEPALESRPEITTKEVEDIPQVPMVDDQKQLQEPQKTKPIDRDRITDILKRYSLYDNYEDDESE